MSVDDRIDEVVTKSKARHESKELWDSCNFGQRIIKLESLEIDYEIDDIHCDFDDLPDATKVALDCKGVYLVK